ncbi:CBWD5 [Symbiodinium microadriaticum]|nr:CBWD5 [Symbiodinium microadriaticum]
MILPDAFDFLASPFLVPVLCTGAVFWMHSKKQKPDETSQLRQMLWGIQFEPFRQQQQLMIGLLGCLGLLLLVVAAAVRLGPLAGALALAVASLGLRPLWRLVLGKLRRLRSRNLLCSKGGSADSDLEPCEAKLPVWIVTGFLGSGKTTLVNHILRQGHRLLVIQNETGDTSLDAELVIEAAGEENVMLINGCACCQIRRDLRDLLCRVRDKGMGDVEGIVIECCGLADPRAVVQTFLLDEEMKSCLQIQEVIAVIDAAHVARHLLATTSTPAARLVEVQIAFASVLLLNKIDQCDDFDALRPAIRAINSVQILPCTYCEVDFATLLAGAGKGPCTKPWRQDGGWSPFRALTEDIQLRSICVSDHEDQQPSPEGPLPDRPQIRCISVRVWGSLELDAFNRWVLRTLQDMDVMRAKGVLAISGYDAKFAFQAVHVAFDGTVALASKWGKDERRFSEVVIIGFEVRADLIEHGLKRCRA